MRNIILQIKDTHGISHGFTYPWDYDALNEAINRGVGRAVVLNLLRNGPLDLHVTELQSELPIISGVAKIKIRGGEVVFAVNENDAVKLLFDNNFSKAYEDVFTPQELSDDEDRELWSMIDWDSIIDTMKSHNHFEALGHGFYADLGMYN